MSLRFTQGDTGPDITAIIHLEDAIESPTDLTGASVRFQMRLAHGGRYKVDAAAVIDADPETGGVSYAWGANDLAQPGTYDVQWQVTFDGGKIQTTEPPVELVVRRQ
jgi:hypothetical protein